MTLLEVISKAKELTGEAIPAGTVRRWASEGLVPTPTKVPITGPSGGMRGDWPEESAAEVAATWRTLRGKWLHPTREAVRVARMAALEIGEKPQGFIDLLSDGTASDGTKGAFLGGELQSVIVTWGVAREKVMAGWPLDKPAAVAHRWLVEPGPDPKYSYLGVELKESKQDTLGSSTVTPEHSSMKGGDTHDKSTH